MTSDNKKIIGVGALVLLLVVGAAVGATYYTQRSMTETSATETPAKKRVAARPAQRTEYTQASSVQQQQQCDDGNIVGTAIGGVAGGILGNQIGNGSGNTAATIGGTLGGAYLGNQYIPTRGVACR